jgi:CDP-paratose 2-epimerase
LINSRIGDHQWYISDNSKFIKDYPQWNQKYDYKMILDEIIKKEISKN